MSIFDTPIRVETLSDGSVEARYDSSVSELSGYYARVVADSITDKDAPHEGNRLVTLVVSHPRSILSEMNTHRQFCLSGDSHITFTGDGDSTHIMTVRDFVKQWKESDPALSTLSIKQFNETKKKVHYAHVVGVSESGVKDVYTLTTESGHHVKSSENHLFFTTRGWLQLHEIQVNVDSVYVEDSFQADSTISPSQVVSVEYSGVEETFDLEISGKYPNFLANGIVVHNSRNSASSRARSVKTTISHVMNTPYIPHFTANRKGMSGEFVEGDVKDEAKRVWLESRNNQVDSALRLLVGDLYPPQERLVDDWESVVDTYYEKVYKHSQNGSQVPSEALNIHKQDTNRLLEPYMWHEAIISSTHWENFLRLRTDRNNAQPAIVLIAQLIQAVLETSVPVERDMHLPFVPKEMIPEKFTDVESIKEALLFSASECARVSYENKEVGKVNDNTALGRRLLQLEHLSPFEHSAVRASDIGGAHLYPAGCLGDKWVHARSIFGK